MTDETLPAVPKKPSRLPLGDSPEEAAAKVLKKPIAQLGALRSAIESSGVFEKAPPEPLAALKVSAIDTVPSMPLVQLVDSPFNTRRNFGDLEELAASIRKVGLLQPIVVRPIEGDATGFEIISGHRRVRAAKLAGLLAVRAEIRNLLDSETIEAQFVENVQRETLTPLEEAESLEQLQKKAGYTPEQIGDRVGKSRSWVYMRLKLLQLCPEARAALAAGRLPETLAIELARRPSRLQAKALEVLAPKKGEAMTFAEGAAYLRNELARPLRSAPFDLKDDMLSVEAGSCLKCPKNSKNEPDLFDKADGSAGLCCDVPCYERKLEAHTARELLALEKGGAKLATSKSAPGAPAFFSDGGLLMGSPYVKADEPVGADPKRRTWGQILEKLPEAERPQLYAAAAPGHGVARLFTRADATAAAAKLGHAFAKQDAKLDKEDEKDRAKAKKVRADRKRRSDVVRAVGERVALKAYALDHATARELRWVLLAYLETRNVEAVLERRELAEPKLESWIEKASAPDLLGFLLECVVDQFGSETGDGYSEDLEALADSYKIEIKTLEKSLGAVVETKPAKPAKAKKKGGAK